MHHTLNFAHRGYCAKYPENTLLAFRKAIEAGCDGIELDVQLSRDGELIILHDEALERTTNGTGFAADYTLAELKQLCAGRDESGLPCRIPTLREYFELTAGTGIQTNIELKTGVNPYPGIEKKVLAMVDEFSQREKVIISSFNHYSILRMKALAPELCCGLLTESWIVDFADYAKKLGAECVHPVYYYLQPEYVAELHQAGLRINTWTVNDPADMRALLERGVDAFIGNDPALIGETIRRWEQASAHSPAKK